MAQEMHTPHTAGDGVGGVATAGGTSRATTAMRRSGWLTFAAVMFLAAGALDALWGISALVNDSYFAVDELLFGDLSMWGVIYLVFAAIQVGTGLLILRRSALGAMLGIGIALLHALMVLMSIGAYPIWSVVLLAIDGLIVYGLTAHGFADADADADA